MPETPGGAELQAAQQDHPLPSQHSFHGDTGNFDDFFRSDYATLLTFLRRSGATAAEAEDVAQETMEVVFKQWPRLQQPRPFAYRVAMRSLTRLRSRSRELAPRLASAGWLSRPGKEPEHERSAEGEMVLSLLRELPPRQRMIMALLVDGYPAREIAELLGLTESTVRSHLSQARKVLAQRVRDVNPLRPEVKSRD